MLLSNSAYVQASILWATMTPIIYKFYRWGGLLPGAGCCSVDTACLHQLVSSLLRSTHQLLAALCNSSFLHVILHAAAAHCNSAMLQWLHLLQAPVEWGQTLRSIFVHCLLCLQIL